MAGIKSLAKDTAIYGLSSIVGRFLNWCLVPIYTNVFAADQYGIVTLIYSAVALLLIILTYGMETGFFRFANHERWSDPIQVYSTSLVSLGISSVAFIAAACLLSQPIADAMECGAHPSYIWMMAIAVGIDAFISIPFAYLRYQRRPVRFATLRLLNIGINISLNLFFILLCPWLWKTSPEWIAWFYDPTFGIGYIFLANLISSLVTLLTLYPEITAAKLRFCGKLWREMMSYSFPLLVLGIAGIMNQTIDKILYPMLVSDKTQAMTDLGIYGANYKIAIVMVMFIQAFRFAYEPFIFAQHKQSGDDGKMAAYRDAMKYFVIFGLFIFLGVMFYIDILKYFISPKYFSGLKVVPVIMIAELFFGVFFNLSLWYKLTDKTIWGMWFSLMGLGITLALNIAFVPRWGYMACAWAAFGCYGAMMVTSYFVGLKKYPIGYNVRRLLLYGAIASVLYAIGTYGIATPMPGLNMALRTAVLAVYVAAVFKIENIKLSSLTKLRHRRPND